MKDFHEFNGNSYCLTNSASADFRDARSKLGDYLHDFHLWVIKNQEPPSFKSGTFAWEFTVERKILFCQGSSCYMQVFDSLGN